MQHRCPRIKGCVTPNLVVEFSDTHSRPARRAESTSRTCPAAEAPNSPLRGLAIEGYPAQRNALCKKCKNGPILPVNSAKLQIKRRRERIVGAGKGLAAGSVRLLYCAPRTRGLDPLRAAA